MLTTYSPAFDYSALDRAAIGETTRKKYISAIRRLVASGINPFDHEALAEYAAALPSSTRSFTKAALRVMAQEYEQKIKAGATPENIQTTQAALLRLEAMTDAIHIQQPKGKEMSIWLSAQEVERITALPDRTTQTGRRDWIVLAVLLGAGLRREELSGLRFDQIKHQPTKDGLRTVLSITGKGRKRRTVPISSTLANHLKEWERETGGGYVARAFVKGGVMRDRLSSVTINAIVGKYGAVIGKPDLQAHDCRRTYAQLGLNAGVPITQISVLLGHSTVAVTQKYLDLHIDLEATISDHIPLSGD